MIIGNRDLLVLISLLKLILLVRLSTFLFLVSSGRILTRLHLCVCLWVLKIVRRFFLVYFHFLYIYFYLNSRPFFAHNSFSIVARPPSFIDRVGVI